MKQLFLFLAASFSFFCGAQQKEMLELKIDSIITDNAHTPNRQFHLYFHIRNLTDDPLSFFLNPDRLQANAVSSLSNTPFYRLYQENSLMDIAGVFDRWHRPDARQDATLTELRTLSEEDYRQYRNDNISANIQRLAPHAVKQLCVTLVWDKERYFKEGDLEFYLDAKAQHYIEIAVNLLKEEYADYLKKDQLYEVSMDKCFIRGWYLSNRVGIDFGE